MVLVDERIAEAKDVVFVVRITLIVELKDNSSVRTRTTTREKTAVERSARTSSKMVTSIML